MDMYEKLSRLLMRRKYEKLSGFLMRRKYEKVDRSRSSRNQQGFVVKRKSVIVRIPKGETGKKVVREEAGASEPLPIVNPKRFTILSSANDVVDEAWLKAAVNRTVAEGRLNVLTKEYPQ